jgi:hypothetical protein
VATCQLNFNNISDCKALCKFLFPKIQKQRKVYCGFMNSRIVDGLGRHVLENKLYAESNKSSVEENRAPWSGFVIAHFFRVACKQRDGQLMQPTTTMGILSFRGFDWNPAEGADAAKWLKST